MKSWLQSCGDLTWGCKRCSGSKGAQFLSLLVLGHVICVDGVMRYRLCRFSTFSLFCYNTVHRDEIPKNIFEIFYIYISVFFCYCLSAQLSFCAMKRSKVKLQSRRMLREKMLSLHMGQSVCQGKVQ